jgi:hypothetical protein
MTRRLAAVGVVAFAVALTAVRVAAAPAQTPPSVPPATTAPTATSPVWQTTPTPTPPPPGDRKPPTGESLIPDAGVGEYPTSHFDIGYDEGAWNSFGRKALGFFTGFGWTLNRWVVGATLWLVGWAFGFDIIGPLQAPILTVATALRAQLLGPLQLEHFVWFVVVAYAGIQILRGRAMSGLGEFALSFIALTVATVISANPAGYVDGATATLRQTSGAVMALTRGAPPPETPSPATQLVDPLRASLHEGADRSTPRGHRLGSTAHRGLP